MVVPCLLDVVGDVSHAYSKGITAGVLACARQLHDSGNHRIQQVIGIVELIVSRSLALQRQHRLGSVTSYIKAVLGSLL